jgi:hypothetical protein
MSANMTLAAVDTEFRAELAGNPDAYGVSPEALAQLGTVAQPDQETLDLWTEGVAAMEVYACITSCSFGPVTAVCDGTSK